MSTPIQEVIDAFISKIDEDTTDQEDIYFGYLKSAIAKSYKTTINKLDYKLNNSQNIELLNTPKTDGIINLIINGTTLVITVLSIDTQIVIADKIKNVIDTMANSTFTTKVIVEDNTIVQATQLDGLDNNIIFNDVVNTGLLINIKNSYDGYFLSTLQDDEIELLALNMLYAHKSRRKQYLEKLEKLLGTKDFNNSPTYSNEMKNIGDSMKDLKDEINDLKQQFNTYNYE